MADIRIQVAYTQLAVFDAQLASPFNDWTDAHVAQGFSWRPGSVSFATLDGSGPLKLRVIASTLFDEQSSLGERVIRVPFRVPEHGEIEVGSVGDSAQVALKPGEYDLVFEHGHEDGEMWANLYFAGVLSTSPPRIIRADSELHPAEALLMQAEPAA